MKKVKRYAKIILGTSVIAIVLNLFFINDSLSPAGVFGLATLYHDEIGMNLSLIILLANLFFFAFGYITLPRPVLRKSYLSFILMPILIFLTKDVESIIDISNVDRLLVALYGGVLLGIGYSLIYKEGRYASGSDIIYAIEEVIPNMHFHVVNYALDGIIVLFIANIYSIEEAFYTLLSIIIVEALSKRASLGISDSKVFYIITKKADEVTNFIIEEMHCELTVFDVKGGFMKSKNKVLMSVIPTKDYYRLKSGVKEIDSNAFISITDSYEVINPNSQIKKKIKN